MRQVQAGSTDLNLLRIYFDVRDDSGPVLTEAGGQPEISTNGGAFTSANISTLSAIGFGKYYADLAPAAVLVAGDVIQSIYSFGSGFVAYADPVIEVVSIDAPLTGITNFEFYGTVLEADTYFANRLNASAWTTADPLDKPKALQMATELIDRLSFAGDKADDNQRLQFPRANTTTDILLHTTTESDTVIPHDIRTACYLIGLRLLDEYDADIEGDNVAVVQDQWSGATTKYDRSFVPYHIAAGIPSSTAWKLLRPYLRDPNEVKLVRSS